MRTLTQHEKRTLRVASVLLAAYLALFYGARGLKLLETKRTDYEKLVQKAEDLKRAVRPYESKALLLEDLRQAYHFSPTSLSRVTLVADASAAIQKAAASGGVQLGALRETAARTSAKELTSMQLEAQGPVPAVTAFLHRLERVGFPLIIDSVQISRVVGPPGMIKLNLTLVILDYDQWKAEEAHHA